MRFLIGRKDSETLRVIFGTYWTVQATPVLRRFLYLDFQLNNPSDAIKQCNEALKIDENDVDALCDRAEAHILNEMYDEGKKMPFFNLYFSCSFFHCFSFISL